MQKKSEILRIGSYKIEIFPEETREKYASLSAYEGEDVAARFFMYLLPRAKKESLDFLASLGIEPEKLFWAKPMSQPDENGEILYLCTARILANVLEGGNTEPRQSEETHGISMIFVSDAASFREGPKSLGDGEVELRFVIPLPFDASFFENME